MAVNITSIEISSIGVWLGDNPLNCAFPLLIIQTILILSVSRTLAFIFKPLRQPRVVAEILGGILLGPSGLGRSQSFTNLIFPSWSSPILGSVANMGLVFFLFLVGMELDLSSIRRSGRRAVAVGTTGIATTFLCGAGLAAVLHRTIDGGTKASYSTYTIFIGVAISITALGVLARILAELKLLTTGIGETAMAAAAINDVAAWVFLAVVVSLAGDGGDGPKKSPATPAWILLSCIGFLVLMMAVVKPAMRWVGRKCSSEHTASEEVCICFTLAGVLASSFLTDMIGIHSIFGAFLFGLTIPKEGDFCGKLTEKIEYFVSSLLLPLYFASSGLNTDVSRISNSQDVELLVLAIVAACVGKILGTFVIAMLCKFPARDSLTLGFLMNTKGLVEIIVLNIGKDAQVIGDESFTILVIMAIFTTFLTTPIVMAIYKPFSTSKLDDKPVPQSSKSDEASVLACVHGPDDVPSIISLIELTRRTDKSSPLKLYIMHLIELTDMSSSIIKFQRWRRNGLPMTSCLSGRGTGEIRSSVAAAFGAYAEVGRAKTMLVTAVSPLATMHKDVCRVATENNASMILIPFHKRRNGGSEEIIGNHGWSAVNQLVLQEARCAVAVMVDRGHCLDELRNVCLVFLGGSDDRKALEVGCMMVEKPWVKVTVMRFNSKISISGKELDDTAIWEFQRRCEERGEVTENPAVDIFREIVAIGRSGDYGLILLGKGSSTAEQSELGVAGDLLASFENEITSSVLVVQSEKKEGTESTSIV